MTLSVIQGGLIGLAVGDALGVPVEFLSRAVLQAAPVITMQGYGTHQQPVGTWSDDASMTFCLTESIIAGLDLNDVAERFVRWYKSGYWTPHGVVFDMGITTRQALTNIQRGIPLEKVGLDDEFSNGNGSLMRILPLAFWLIEKPLSEQIATVQQISSLTHRHIRTVSACVLYIEYALLLLDGINKTEAYQLLKSRSIGLFNLLALPEKEVRHFDRVLKEDITKLPADAVRGSGYVVHSLEASLWSFLKTDSYEEAVLTAVNLGEDTDTTAAITGGIAGLYYGIKAIPTQWTEVLAQKVTISNLAERLQSALQNQSIQQRLL